MRKLKMKKTIGFLALILVGVGSVYAADPDPFATAASKITGMSSSMMDLFDVLIGVNLLREGLDMPEVTLIGILDADKAGFLRSKTALVQTIGRAARNDRGRVTVYADHMTEALEYAISETARRREIQHEYNKKNGITPKTIQKAIKDITEHLDSKHDKTVVREVHDDLIMFGGNVKKLIKYKRKGMEDAVEKLDFERAAILRDEILILEKKIKTSE